MYTIKRHHVAAALAGALALSLSACSEKASGNADDYPKDRTVQLIAPSDPGGGWDTTIRTLDDVLSKEGLLGKGVKTQVVNEDGATGAVSLEKMVGQRKGDPYWVSVTSLAIMTNGLAGVSKHGYQDVTMLTSLMEDYYVIATAADSKYKTLDDLLADIKEDPGAVPISAGGDDDLPMALLIKAAGGDAAKANLIEFDEQAIPALLSGEAAAGVSNPAEISELVADGDLRPLAVMTDERLGGELADTPTTVELGYDVTIANWRGLMAPPGVPDAVVDYWVDLVKEVTATPTWKDAAERYNWNTMVLSGDEFDDYLAKAQADLEEAAKALE